MRRSGAGRFGQDYTARRVVGDMAWDDSTDAPADEHCDDDAADDPPVRDVLVVGGGAAGLTTAMFTARAGLDTLVVNGGESILRRNAHLENFPGFPAGVNARLFVDMLEAQATRNGADVRGGRVAALDRADGDAAFVARVVDGEGGDTSDDGVDDDGDAETIRATRVVAASWADADYLDGLGASSETWHGTTRPTHRPTSISTTTRGPTTRRSATSSWSAAAWPA